MKNKVLGIILVIGLFVAIVAGAYAFSVNFSRNNMMGGWNGNNMMRYNNGQGMMRNLDSDTIAQMNEYHEKVISNLDEDSARRMDAMHDACLGNND